MRKLFERVRHREYCRKYRKRNKAKCYASAKKWRKRNREKVLQATRRYHARFNLKEKARNRAYKDMVFFGGNRDAVLKRDGYKCVLCGITDAKHREKFGRSITIDHKDGNGHNKERNMKNNSMDNLQTLCCRCHTQKDILMQHPEWRAKECCAISRAQALERIRPKDAPVKVKSKFYEGFMACFRLQNDRIDSYLKELEKE